MADPLLAPLRTIEGLYPERYRGGYRLILSCGHRVHGDSKSPERARSRCVKCRDEAVAAARSAERNARKAQSNG